MRQIIIDKFGLHLLKSLPSVDIIDSAESTDTAFRSTHIIDADGEDVIVQVLDTKTKFDG